MGALVSMIGWLAACAAAVGEPGAAERFAQARQYTLVGRYEEAEALLDGLAGDGDWTVRAACARAEIDRLLGRYEGGIRRLEVVERAAEQSSAWNAALACLLSDVGRYEEAVRRNSLALELDENNHRARWQLGTLYETLGRIGEAVETYRPADELVTAGELPADPEGTMFVGRMFYRFTILSRHEEATRRTRHVLTEVFQDACDHLDPLYWPARQAGAELLLEKHNLAEAKGDFEVVGRQNPRVADPHVGLSWVAAEQMAPAVAERHARTALKINPRHVAAHVALAHALLALHRFADAARACEEALKTNPNSVEALSTLAAARLRLGDEAASGRIQERVLQINPRPARLYATLAAWLYDDYRFAEAEAHFKKAVEYAPAWTLPRTGLGRLYMDIGDETSARRVLEESFAMDSFDAQTHQVLALLDQLDKFGRITSPHAVFRFDRKSDGAVASYFAEALDAASVELCERYATRLAKPTIVEMFPDQMGFSVRISGRPFIPTVGACCGRVIALAAPRGDGPFGRFNWRAVLRHELTHTVTLAATDFRIPRWMTEGLAVHEERPRIGWSEREMLAADLRRGRLFTLEHIDAALRFPKEPGDAARAYAQGRWMVEFILERWGLQPLRELLRGLKRHRTIAKALPACLKTEVETFERDFREWAAGQVARWGFSTTPVEDAEKIEARLEAGPVDADALARLAEAELMEGDLRKAESAARRALEARKDHPLALEVLCRALVNRMLAETEESERWALIEKVEPFVDRLLAVGGAGRKNPFAVKYRGYIEQAWGQWPEAVRWLEEYQRRMPDDPDSYRRIAAIHLHRGDEEAALAQLEVLADLVDDDTGVIRRIAEMRMRRGEAAAAAKWYRRFIDIDPYDVAIHIACGKAHLAAGDYEGAVREFEVVTALKPGESEGYAGLSLAHKALGNLAKAEAYEKQARSTAGGGAGDGSP